MIILYSNAIVSICYRLSFWFCHFLFYFENSYVLFLYPPFVCSLTLFAPHKCSISNHPLCIYVLVFPSVLAGWSGLFCLSCVKHEYSRCMPQCEWFCHLVPLYCEGRHICIFLFPGELFLPLS